VPALPAAPGPPAVPAAVPAEPPAPLRPAAPLAPCPVGVAAGAEPQPANKEMASPKVLLSFTAGYVASSATLREPVGRCATGVQPWAADIESIRHHSNGDGPGPNRTLRLTMFRLLSLSAVCSVSLALLTACSGGDPGAAGAGGSASGSTGTAGNGSPGGTTSGGTSSGAGGSSAGTTTGGSFASGGIVGNGGTSTAGSSGAGGSGGTAGGSGGSSGGGTGGSGGSSGGGTGGASFWGPGGPKKQWECPAGPFPAQSMGQQTNICVGFTYNYGYNEGPTWIKSQGAFFFSNFIQGSNEGGDIIKYTLGGACEVWLHEVGCNGLGVSPSGNLLGACHGPRAIMEYNVETKQGRMVATMAGGKMFDSPNDLIARSDGNVYFSNTTYELGNRPPGGLGSALIRIDPMGITSVIQTGGINGLALSPDETKLSVVQMGTWTLDAAGLPGQKGGPTPGGDGIAVDCAGNISNNGTNSAYGGPDGKTLIVVGGGTNAKTIAMTVPGLP
jgi:gluconolactonase